MKIFFAADHAGFEMKNTLMSFVEELGYEVEDCGAYELNPDDDYPEFVARAAMHVSQEYETARAIVLGGSGQGEAIIANRFPRIRAVVFNGQYQPSDGREVPEEIKTAREHNDANVLSLGARFLSITDAKEAVHIWLTTPFSNEERHIRRLKEIEQYSHNG